jgi:mRNA interferase RelE/StbE
MKRYGIRMQYRLLYHPLVKEKDLQKLNTTIQQRIRSAIENRLLHEPEKFSEPLRKTLKGYRKLRVGDYRVVLRIDGNTIYILGICHRRDVYERIKKRLK